MGKEERHKFFNKHPLLRSVTIFILWPISFLVSFY